jgi:hypothetical protein
MRKTEVTNLMLLSLDLKRVDEFKVAEEAENLKNVITIQGIENTIVYFCRNSEVSECLVSELTMLEVCSIIILSIMGYDYAWLLKIFDMPIDFKKELSKQGKTQIQRCKTVKQFIEEYIKK